MTKKLLITLVAIAIAAVSSYGQLEEKIKKENVTPGAIIKDGKKIEGFIKTIHMAFTKDQNFPAPWSFQGEIKFIPKEDFIKLEKIKNKNFQKLKAKDIEGYEYDTLVYESVKYADLSAVGPGMLPKKLFMRKVHAGKISIYHHFATPPSVASGPEGFAPYYIECGKPNLVYRIGESGKLSLVNSLNIKKELDDCPLVVEKHEKGEYNITNEEGKEGGKGEKLLNNFLFRDDVRLLAIEDFNNNCN